MVTLLRSKLSIKFDRWWAVAVRLSYHSHLALTMLVAMILPLAFLVYPISIITAMPSHVQPWHPYPWPLLIGTSLFAAVVTGFLIGFLCTAINQVLKEDRRYQRILGGFTIERLLTSSDEYLRAYGQYLAAGRLNLFSTENRFCFYVYQFEQKEREENDRLKQGS